MKLARYLLILITAVALFAAPPQKKGTGKSDSATKTATSSKLIDINAASEAELKALPGIGDAYSAKIIQNRPYRAKNELVQKKIIPEATYEKIKGLIVAHQPGTGKAATGKKK